MDGKVRSELLIRLVLSFFDTIRECHDNSRQRDYRNCIFILEKKASILCNRKSSFAVNFKRAKLRSMVIHYVVFSYLSFAKFWAELWL